MTNNIVDTLSLQLGTDVIFADTNALIHQPTLSEIAFIGENRFWEGLGVLMFSKDKIPTEDNSELDSQSNFNIILAILTNTQEIGLTQVKQSAKAVLDLLFLNYDYTFNTTDNYIDFVRDDFHFQLNQNNFDIFQKVLKEIFDMGKNTKDTELNPQSKAAKEIANKLRRGREKVAQSKAGNNTGSVLSLYISILSVGQQKDMLSFRNYTVYQLFDEFQRYQLKMANDIHMQAAMAGASGLKDPENWMENIH